MSERFEKAMKALIRGYLNGTLAKGTDCGCACGNIVAAAVGAQLWWDTKYSSVKSDKNNSSWFWLKLGYSLPSSYEQVELTGYSVDEFLQIENTFEKNTKIGHREYRKRSEAEIDEDQLRGLYAVTDLLCQLEGIADSKPYKAQFDKSLSLAEAGL